MSQSLEISNEDLYGIFTDIGVLRNKIKEQDPIGSRGFVELLDEVLKLRAEVEKLKANQPTRINE